MLTQRAEEAAPPKRRPAHEGTRCFAVTHRMVRSKSAEAAVLNRDEGAARTWFEAHFDLGLFVGSEVAHPPVEKQPVGRLPESDAPRFVNDFPSNRLEQAPAEPRLELQHAILAAHPIFEATAPPQVDLFGEYPKSFCRWHLHEHRDGGLVTGRWRCSQRDPGFRRSACALKAESCAPQNASTSDSQ